MYDVESWAYLKDDPTKAVKVFVRLTDEPDANKMADIRSQAAALFRRTYSVWADGLGEKVSAR